MTDAAMREVNTIIVDRMQSEIELIPTLAGHLVASGGKRMRPMLTLAGAMMAGGKTDLAAKLAAAVEFIHTATLLHDDVIDASDLRRGKATANAIWGNEASVLVGDFLFARAFELMVETGNIEVLGKLAAASARITEGEISQMLIAGKPDTPVENYLTVIIGKTAELFAAAAETGAMVAGGDSGLAGIMRQYGMELGIAFQIADDALDYQADQSALGKTVGDDFAEGKTTLPVMIAYADGTAEEKKFWQRTIGEGRIEDGDLAEAQRLLLRHDAIGRALTHARTHAESAARQLETLPGSDIRDALIEAASFAASRAA
ncbi:polyprenyl synthetase family protein [Alphaproteobacteria bacterium LSUCC0684]